MKKYILLDNLNTKIVKQISNILLGIPEIDEIEADLDTNSLTLFLNSRLSTTLLKSFLNSTQFKIIKIEDEK